MSIFKKYQERYEDKQPEELSLQEYLELCKTDHMAYASPAERMLAGIGEPVLMDTRDDERLSRIFTNRKIKTYPKAFSDFYGMEDVIEQIVSYFKHSAQNLEESKSILYLLGPTGSAKSSVAERLKSIMQRNPIYTIKAFNEARGEWEISPIVESPLGLFDVDEDADDIKDQYGIDARYIATIMSPWAVKRLCEAKGDISKFTVVKLWPSILNQIAITKVEPGDENNNDIGTLVGKVNIRELEEFPQSDVDAYSFTGGLNYANQGILDFVEMFKSPKKLLHPLLTATQEHHYNGTEAFGAIPFNGIILAHSNETEWAQFRNDKSNEAFLDRISVIKVPYSLRVYEETLIYQKLIEQSDLAKAPVAPGTFEMMAQYSVLTRLVEPENSNIYSKLCVYNGENLKDEDPTAKSVTEYRDYAGVNEGMHGNSTRNAFKTLSRVFNFDADEIAANPIHLMYVLEKQIIQDQLPPEEEERRLSFIKGVLAPKYAEALTKELQKALLESYSDYGQNMFDRYFLLADAWVESKDYRDPDTGEIFDRDSLNSYLEKIEKPAGVSNSKDFRNEVVGYILRQRAHSDTNVNPKWTSYTKMRDVIEKTLFKSTEDLLPVISFTKKSTEEEQQKHNDFVQRLLDTGLTLKQVKLLCNWHVRYNRHS